MRSDEVLLDEAIALATRCHAGQVDKGGNPYIDHCLRVMERVRKYGRRAMAAGVLHDTVEDTALSFADLWSLDFPPDIVFAVGSVTRNGDEARYQAVLRAARDPIGLVVKIADLEDHLDPAYIEHCPPTLIKHYERSLRYLRSR